LVKNLFKIVEKLKFCFKYFETPLGGSGRPCYPETISALTQREGRFEIRSFCSSGAGALAGGWELEVILSMATGSPVGIMDGLDRSNTDSTSMDRPNAVAGQSSRLSNPTPQKWFNVRAFAFETQYTFGNLGRNTVIRPPLFSVDSSIKKEMTFKNA
jgi:hypothetical protein